MRFLPSLARTMFARFPFLFLERNFPFKFPSSRQNSYVPDDPWSPHSMIVLRTCSYVASSALTDPSPHPSPNNTINKRTFIFICVSFLFCYALPMGQCMRWSAVLSGLWTVKRYLNPDFWFEHQLHWIRYCFAVSRDPRVHEEIGLPPCGQESPECGYVPLRRLKM